MCCKILRYLLSNHCIHIQKADTEFKDDSEVIEVVNNPESIEVTNNIKNFFNNKKVVFRVGLKVDIDDYIHHLTPTTNPSNKKYFEIEEASTNSLHNQSVSKKVSTMEKECTKKNLVKEHFYVLKDKGSGSTWNDFELESEQEDANLIDDNDSGLVRLTNKILTDASDIGASDIHIEPGEVSLTDHLVFSTLHTNSAPETITRLVNLGMKPLNFADALLLITSKRLVKTFCKE
jgi:type II secretory ATPase GspE/PulE/Tfp pilus assembly ATPase PilB-like protein